MKIWKDKEGKSVSGKEFFQRWKQGIQAITPMQQTKSNLFGYIIVLIGIVWGLIFTFKIDQWWLFIILIGSLIVSGTQFLGIYQKYLILSELERRIENGIEKNTK